jgi:IMP dehydrogenase
MIHTCTEEMNKLFMAKNICSTIHRYFDTPEDQYEYWKTIRGTLAGGRKGNNPFFAVGTVKKWKEWIDYLIKNRVEKFCIDVAHGDSVHCVDTIKYIKENAPWSTVMAGNVAMMAGFAELEQAGADLIRVGIASGSICSTYLNTGVGTPIVTSLIECHKVRRKAKIIADGGVKHPGDIAKAMAVGADYVMLGGMLASTSMGAGDCYDKNKELVAFPFGANEKDIAYKEYAGMASTAARSTTKSQSVNASIEGVSGLVKYSGDTEEYINSIHNNLRASMCYLGARTWREFTQRAKVMQISSASRSEKDTFVV